MSCARDYVQLRPNATVEEVAVDHEPSSAATLETYT